jgi:uncharacterized protein with PIN domain
VLDRIQEGYRQKFRSLLAQVRPRRLEFGVELLMGRARKRSERDGVPLPQALSELYELTRIRVEKRVALMSACSLGPFPAGLGAGEAPRFLCDASLGGLARWLRAAGYEARWLEGGRGDELLRQAHGSGEVLVTTDSRLIGRRAVSDGWVKALWVPSGMKRLEQLAMVLRDLGLRPRPPRCMACGGTMAPVEKAAVRERIPPRTALWKDSYCVCGRCGKLFWEGTHWERIARRLERLASP